jgi:hypothetical protein
VESPGGPAGMISASLGRSSRAYVRVKNCEEQGNAQSCGGQFVAMAVWDPLNETMQTESAQIVGHPAHGVMGWVETQQLSHFLGKECI